MRPGSSYKICSAAVTSLRDGHSTKRDLYGWIFLFLILFILNYKFILKTKKCRCCRRFDKISISPVFPHACVHSGGILFKIIHRIPDDRKRRVFRNTCSRLRYFLKYFDNTSQKKNNNRNTVRNTEFFFTLVLVNVRVYEIQKCVLRSLMYTYIF